MSGTPENEYVLGTDEIELERLHFQHTAWLQAGHALWEKAGIAAGDTVLDLGCGPGYTSFELAKLVGPGGRVIAADISDRFLEFLNGECARQSLPQIDALLGDVNELAIEPASLDAAYARWLFCWLDDPVAAVGHVATMLKPGAVLVMQEYIDWAAMKIMPADDLFDRTIEVCMQSWHDAGGMINVSERIPDMAQAHGLIVDYFRPVGRLGAVGSLEWRWLEGFFRSYLPRLVERGRYTQKELDAWIAMWEERAREGTSYVLTPTMADSILRKPRDFRPAG